MRGPRGGEAIHARIRRAPMDCFGPAGLAMTGQREFALLSPRLDLLVEPDLFRNAVIVGARIILDKKAHPDKRRLCYGALSDCALIREILPEDRGPHSRVNNFGSNEVSVFAPPAMRREAKARRPAGSIYQLMRP